MEGVQFLLRDPVYITEYSWGFSPYVIPMSVFAIISIIGVIKFFKEKEYRTLCFFIVCAVSFIARALTFCSFATETEVYDHAKYQVTISDDVKLKEFMELYEIVDVDGEFYTIVIKAELEKPLEIA